MSFNWRLLLAPEPVLDYVVWHEVCHLEVMDHSPRFWRLLAARSPGYRAQLRWLRANGPTLVLRNARALPGLLGAVRSPLRAGELSARTHGRTANERAHGVATGVRTLFAYRNKCRRTSPDAFAPATPSEV